MTEDYKKWWLYYVKSQTPEGYFHLPLTPKPINDLTPEEFELYYDNDCELVTNNSYGIAYFLCKKNSDDDRN